MNLWVRLQGGRGDGGTVRKQIWADRTQRFHGGPQRVLKRVPEGSEGNKIPSVVLLVAYSRAIGCQHFVMLWGDGAKVAAGLW